jgi:toxin CcdB
MAQFDIYANPLAASRDQVPYVVDVQSSFIDQLPSRLVMPLSRLNTSLTRPPANLCPVIEVDGETLVLMPHLAAPVAKQQLRRPVGSLADRAHEISAALDAVISGL